MKKVIFFFFFFLFFFDTLNALESTIDWKKSYGGSINESLSSTIVLDDGTYVSVGSVESTNSNIPSSTAFKGKGDAWIVRYNDEGDIIWSTFAGGTAYDCFKEVFYTDDNSLIALGYTLSKNIDGFVNPSGWDLYIAKFDLDGNIIWQKNWNNGGNRHDFNLFLALDDGFIVSPLINTNYNGKILLKYDFNGNLLWQKDLGGSDEDLFNDIILLQDDNVLLVGEAKSTDISSIVNNGESDAYIVKIDPDNGNVIWKNSFGGSLNDQFLSCFENENNEIVVHGNSESTDLPDLKNNGDFDIIAIRYDKNGNILSKNIVGGTKMDKFKNILLFEDDSYIIGSYSESDFSQMVNKGKRDALLIRYDKNGEILWMKNFGGNDNDDLFLSYNNKNCFYLAGWTYSTDFNGLETKTGTSVILKLDLNGNIIWEHINSDSLGWYNYVIPDSNGNILTYAGTYASIFEGMQSKGQLDLYFIKFSFKYDVKTNEPVGGSFDVELKNTYGVIIPKADSKYFIDKIVVKDSHGNDIEVVEKSDNTYTFDLYDDVNIDVSFARNFNIDKKEIINGKVEVVKTDNNVFIKTESDEGYELDKIIVKNSKNELIEVIALEDGTYSFELNDDVSIEVLFKEEVFNPKTGASNIVSVLFTMLLVFVSGLFVIRNYNKNYEI